MFKLSGTVQQIVEGALVAILLYLILNDAQGFSAVVQSLASAATSGVKALQGR